MIEWLQIDFDLRANSHVILPHYFIPDAVPPVPKPVLEDVEPFTVSGLRVFHHKRRSCHLPHSVTTIGTSIQGGDELSPLPHRTEAPPQKPCLPMRCYFTKLSWISQKDTTPSTQDGQTDSGEASMCLNRLSISLWALSIDPEGSTDHAVKASGGRAESAPPIFLYYPDGVVTGTKRR